MSDYVNECLLDAARSLLINVVFNRAGGLGSGVDDGPPPEHEEACMSKKKDKKKDKKRNKKKKK